MAPAYRLDLAVEGAIDDRQELGALVVGEGRHGIDIAQQEQAATEPGNQRGHRIAGLNDDFAVWPATDPGGQ